MSQASRPPNSPDSEAFPTPLFGPDGDGQAPRVVPVSGGAGPQPLGPQQPRFLDRVRREIRLRHYSIRTESAYVDWIRRFIIFNDKRHPNEMGASEVAAFALTHRNCYPC
jgi:Phage integrase, N-terminal SAM-like domain